MGVQNADSKNEAFSNTVLRSDPCLSIGYGSGQYLVGNYWAPSKGDRDGAYHRRWRSYFFTVYSSLVLPAACALLRI